MTGELKDDEDFTKIQLGEIKWGSVESSHEVGEGRLICVWGTSGLDALVKESKRRYRMGIRAQEEDYKLMCWDCDICHNREEGLPFLLFEMTMSTEIC